MTPDEYFSRFPYFVYPQAEALAVAVDPAEAETLRRRVAANVGDTLALRGLVGMDPPEFASFYPDQSDPDLSTEDTIDSFLHRFGGRQGAAVGQTDALPMAPAADYASMLDRLEEEADAPMPADATSSAIDSFLDSCSAPKPVRQTAAAVNSPEAEGAAVVVPPAEAVPEVSAEQAASALTETMARMMIKERNYGKALEIIETLRERNPGKAPIFDDQIRFLRKLIRNGR